MNSARLLIEFETIIHSSPYGGLTELDFNGIKLFEEKDATNEPDYFIQLIVDIVNLLCLCVGFSINRSGIYCIGFIGKYLFSSYLKKQKSRMLNLILKIFSFVHYFLFL